MYNALSYTYTTSALPFHKIVTGCSFGSTNPALHDNGAFTVSSVIHVYSTSTTSSSISSSIHL